MKLNTSLNEIKVWAKWYDGSKGLGTMPIEKALEELATGRAEVIREDFIYLTEKLKPVRERVFERDNHTCYFCGEYGNTLEHLQPTSKGGKTSMDNCVCACNTCNNQKGNMTESEYWKFLINDYINNQKSVDNRLEHVL